MKSVAITGSFASGKSFILNYLKELGYKVFSCDDYVRQLYKDLKIQQDIVDILAIQTFDKNLIKAIYSDDKKRKKLEEYIHPLVRAEISEFKNKYSNEKLLFIEIPLLFETGFNKYFDYSICVYCSEENREKRARLRENFDLKTYKEITKIQLSREEKRNLANFEINTDLGIADTQDQINQIIDQIFS